MKLIDSIESHPLLIPVVSVIAKAISFINVLLLIKIFSIEEYADYSYIISIILWASVLMDSGINDLVYNKSLHKDSDNLNDLFSSKVYLSLIVIIFLSLFFVIKEPILTSSAIVLSFVILFSSLSALFKMYSRGRGYVKVDLITILSEPIFRLIFLVFVYFSGSFFEWHLWQVFLIYLLAGFLAYIFNYYSLSYYFKFKLKVKKLKNAFSTILETLSETKYFLLYYLMLIGLQRIDIIIIENYCSKNDLAIFSTAVTLYQVALLFFYSLITSKLLVFLENKKYLILYLLPGLVIFTIVSQLLSPIVYNYLFPIEYKDGYTIFNNIIISLVPSVFSLVFILMNNYKGKTIINFYVLLFMLILKIIIYNYLKSNDIITYTFVYIFIELLLVLFFMIYNLFNRSNSSKQLCNK